MGVFEDFKAYALTATVPPVKDALTFTTSAFWKACPDCGAAIEYVTFGGIPDFMGDGSIRDREYKGHVFVSYSCRANYYFNDRVRVLSENSVLCPSTRK